jgi:signal transduction histidine kinase
MGFANKFYLRIALALIIWSGVGLVTMITIRRFSAAVRERAEVRRTTLELERLRALLSDAETGQRGFLLTEDKKYLAPYSAAAAKLQGQLDTLAACEQAVPDLRVNVASLSSLVAAKTSELAQSIEVANTKGFAAARQIAQTGEGEKLMDQIRGELDDKQAAVALYIMALDQESRSESARASWALALGYAGTLALMIWALTLLQQEVAQRAKAEGAVRDLNQRLKVQVNELQAVNSELEAFSYSVSHDLRAPLRHITSFADLLSGSGDPFSPKGRRYLDIICDSARQLGRLIDDLLLFARTARVEVNKSSVKLDELVEQSLLDLHLEIANRAIVWKRHPLPVVQADRTLLHQVCLNLIANALKYTRPRNPAKIEIGSLPDGPETAVIFIRDNGVGFDMKYANKLFGVFQRLHRAEDFEGTGIGLANVRRIVHRHGGRVWAESKVEEGATFYFTLPKAPSSSSATIPEATSLRSAKLP